MNNYRIHMIRMVIQNKRIRKLNKIKININKLGEN